MRIAKRNALGGTKREELLRLRRDNRQLKLERDILSNRFANKSKKTSLAHRRMNRIVMKQADGEVTQHISAVAARTLGVSRSGYYDWKRPTQLARAVENESRSHAVVRLYAESDEICGAKKMQADLRDADVESHHCVPCAKS